MAKRNNDASPAGDRAKVRVLFAEVEGNNESIQEALKTMVSAIRRPVRVISDAQLSANNSLFLDTSGVELSTRSENEISDDPETSEEIAPVTARKSRGSGKRSDRNAGLSLVPDLNFRPKGKATFKGLSRREIAEKRRRSVAGLCLLFTASRWAR